MKKTITLLITFALSIMSYAQHHISEYYTFSDSYHTYVQLSAPVISGSLPANSNGGEITNHPIGFDFEYAGTVYNSLTIDVNGAVTFTGSSVHGGNELDGTTADRANVIAPLWDDLYLRAADGGQIRAETTGSAPYRSFHIEWRDMSWYDQGNTVSFQLQLDESTNKITFYYDNFSGDWDNGSDSGSASIGLNEGFSGTNFISVIPGPDQDGGASTSTSVAGNDITRQMYDYDTSGHKYTFTYGPSNDACADAIDVSLPYTNSQPMNGTTNNDGFIQGEMNDGVWYSFTPTHTGWVTVEATASDFDLELAILEGACGAFTSFTSSDEAPNSLPDSEVRTRYVHSGTKYWINAGYFSASTDYQETGTLDISIKYSPPVNDACGDAPVIASFPYTNTQSMLGTTNNNGFIIPTGCGGGMNDGVWYAFVAAETANVTITAQTEFDGEIGVYTGSCGTFTCVGNKDIAGSGGTETLTISTVAGTSYWINIGHYSNQTDYQEYGDMTLTVDYAPPTNDACADAVSISSIPYSNTQSMNHTTNNGGFIAPAGCGSGMNDGVWYTYTATVDANVTITANTTFDSELAVYTGSCGTFTCVDSEDTGNPETLTINTTTGTQYWINIGHFSYQTDYQETGDMTLNVYYAPPANDACTDATVVSVEDNNLPYSVTQSMNETTNNDGYIDVCGSNQPYGMNDGVWYTFTPTTTKNIKITAMTADFDAQLGVYSGSCGSFSCEGNVDDDDTTTNSTETLEVSVVSGTQYWINVGGLHGDSDDIETGNMTLTIENGAPLNDACADAPVIASFPYTNTQSMDNTTNNDGFITPTGCGNGMNDGVWYAFIASETADVTITAQTEFDGEIGVYTGSCGNFTCAGYKDDELSGSTETLTISTVAGTSYWINVGSWSHTTDVQEYGDMTLTVAYAPPANDACADAIVMTYPTYSNTQLLDGTTNNSGFVMSCANGMNDGVWYTFTATSNNSIIIDAEELSNNVNLELAVYTGGCGAFTCVASADDTDSPYEQGGERVIFNAINGTQYWINVGHESHTEDVAETGTLEIEMSINTNPPANDTCADAIELTVGTAFADEAIEATNVNATSTGNTDTNCEQQGSNEPQVWFKVTVPASGSLTIETAAVAGSNFDDSVLGVYTMPSCSSYNEIDCNDDIEQDVLFSRIELTGRTPGEVLHITVENYMGADPGPFMISAYDTSLGYEDMTQNISFSIYPNPTQDSFSIQTATEISTVKIFNYLGKEVARYTNQDTYNVSQLSSGVYFVTVETKEAYGSQKLVIE